ncbi:MAG: HNH endonuclease domain-containing protein [Prevotellaceae bacterium]|nr:HNH endonuclease domain-containing protein [Prevotellaceae bacterium]
MKKILGLDLGTNSIGWAVVSMNEDDAADVKIKLGSRIIPMSNDVMSKFDSGVTVSQTAVRTTFRGTRRLRERYLLRRERLHRVLHCMGFLPKHYDKSLGWNRSLPATYGKFTSEEGAKLAWYRDNDGHWQFLFMDAFREMIAEFARYQPALVADGKRIPFDWTLYYLRKKALSQPVSKAELAWILLNFNQKRGYNQLRGEDEEETPTKCEEFYELKVVSVEATERKQGFKAWYDVHLENGWVYPRLSQVSLDNLVGQSMQFIVTTEYEKDGKTPKKDKNGKVRRTFRAPKEDDWGLRKKRTEKDIDDSQKTVGAYIYEHILQHPSDKIIGNLVRVIERKYYEYELKTILTKQKEFHPELSDSSLLSACAHELYAKNKAHRDNLEKKDFVYLFVHDLIFYQRPLKSKKSLISECSYEKRRYVDKSTGEIIWKGVKCIARSNPYFQEFRLWQFVHQLRILDDMDKDVTSEYLKTKEDYASLFLFLNDLKSIKQDTLFKEFFGIKKPKGKDSKYPVHWNYFEDREIPCNETRNLILQSLKKAGLEEDEIDTPEKLHRLWHLLYSVEDKRELIGALTKLGKDETFVDTFSRLKPFDKQYGSYSEKAIKKLLPLMRMGHLWSAEAISEATQTRIEDVINDRIDTDIKKRIDERGELKTLNDFQGLPIWKACYVVYNRYAEAGDVQRWMTPEELKTAILDFKQHSLRNPIVEQCVLETLRTVHDLWIEYGKFDEIHVEMGRSMKSNADQRKRQTATILRNENTKLRIKRLLMELKNEADYGDVRPYSPIQQDKLRIYEEGALQTLSPKDEEFSDIIKISQSAQPSAKEIERYLLWLDQKYCSPYTGLPISLSKLFTSAYEIEHIIPRSRYFDDSFNNKVICEAEVNKLKDNLLGHEFILKGYTSPILTVSHGNVNILTVQEYERLVKDIYGGNPSKMKRLMLDEIPSDFIQRQMNDSRYISKVVKTLLSNVVRDENDKEATSSHVVVCSGGVTDRLKRDWGVNDVWNTIITPRFERLNLLTGSELFGHWENKEGKRVFQTSVPIEIEKGFNKKRIDHRHHAMDALVIACASRQMISYLNNQSANDARQRHDLRNLLCGKNKTIRKPWITFTQDACHALQDIVVTFKNNIRVINKASNYYSTYDENGKKVNQKQQGNEMWVVRKPLHKDTVFGHVNLKRKEKVSLKDALQRVNTICDKDLRRYIQDLMRKDFNQKQVAAHFKSMDYRWNRRDVKKVEVWMMSDENVPMVATRKPLDTSFDIKRIASITDTGIQKILLRFLEAKGGNPAEVFTPEGIAEMNSDIRLYNDGRFHQPIIKVRVAEPMGAKYPVGQRGNKKSKFVETQKGTNLYFAIYADAEGKRFFESLTLHEVVERQKQGLSPVPEKDKEGRLLKFYLSPNDLVYVPNEDERCSGSVTLVKDRIYKMVSATGKECFFLPATVASVIYEGKEFESMNKIGKAPNGDMIKDVCWKLIVDRLGNVLQIIK